MLGFNEANLPFTSDSDDEPATKKPAVATKGKVMQKAAAKRSHGSSSDSSSSDSSDDNQGKTKPPPAKKTTIAAIKPAAKKTAKSSSGMKHDLFRHINITEGSNTKDFNYPTSPILINS